MSNTPRIDRIDKNFIINGAFDFWQRGGVSAAVNISTSQVYQSCDRFLNYYAGTVTGTPTIERSTDNPGKFARYSAKISSRRNASTVQHIHYQRIESVFARQMSNKNISIGVEVKADVATSVQLKLVSYASADAGGLGTEFEDIVKTITPGAGFQQITFEDLAMPSLANGLGVYIIVNSPSGTDATPQGTWVTELQVKIGKKVQDFSYFGRDYLEELTSCQRYYQTHSAIRRRINAQIMFDGFELPTAMRLFPVGTGTISDNGTLTISDPNSSVAIKNSISFQGSVAATANGAHSISFSLDAEI